MSRRPFFLVPHPRVEWHYLVRVLLIVLVTVGIYLLGSCGVEGLR